MTLRVLHCIYDDLENPWVGGGGAVRVFELYRRLTGRVHAMVLTGRHPGARDQVREGVHYRHAGMARPYPASRLTYAAAAREALRTEAYDAAVFDFSGYTPLFVPRDRPVGITVHHLVAPGAAPRWGKVGARAIGRLERAMLRRARQFSVSSEGMNDTLRRLVGPGAEIARVDNGVPDALFDLPRLEQDYLLYLGRMDVLHKGLDVLLAAFASLARVRPALRLKMAGRGSDGPRVRALARRLHVSRQVEVLGPVSDERRAELFAGALIQWMPSRFEGFGLAAAEAMAAGVPLVASNAGALPEVVGEGGVLVPPDDPDALAAATVGLLDDPGRRQALSLAARRRADGYRWGATAQAHLAFLQRIAGGGP